MEHMGDIKALFIIVNAGYYEEVIDIARQAGAKGATIINSRGNDALHQSIMGITIDMEREIILTLVNKETADKVMAAIKEKAGIHTPANGFCFTVPVEETTQINNFTTTLGQDA